MISQAGSFQEDLGFPSWPMIWVFLLLLPQTDRKLSMCDMSKVHIFCHVKNVNRLFFRWNGRGPVVTTGNPETSSLVIVLWVHPFPPRKNTWQVAIWWPLPKHITGVWPVSKASVSNAVSKDPNCACCNFVNRPGGPMGLSQVVLNHHNHRAWPGCELQSFPNFQLGGGATSSCVFLKRHVEKFHVHSIFQDGFQGETPAGFGSRFP